MSIEDIKSALQELRHLAILQQDELKQIRQLAVIQSKNTLTMEEASVYTGLSLPYLYQMTSKHLIPFYKSPGGGKNYFKKEELDEWLTSCHYNSIEETMEGAR